MIKGLVARGCPPRAQVTKKEAIVTTYQVLTTLGMTEVLTKPLRLNST